MKFRCFAFNIYLLAALLLMACKSPQEKIDSANARKEKKELSTIRLHLETRSDVTGMSIPVSILRTAPISLNVAKDSLLDERDVVRATVLDYMGGIVIQIQFDEHGTLVLDATSSAHKGNRLAIMSDFGESRWLAAPALSKRITDGVVTFTPDATREEALRIVRGLNNTVLQIRKQNRFLPGW